MKKSAVLSVCLLGLAGLTMSVRSKFVGEKGTSPPVKNAAIAQTTSTPKGSVSRQSAPTPGIKMYEQIEEAPGWTIRYGGEFWQSPAAPQAIQKPDLDSQAAADNVDLGAIIDRVSHAIGLDKVSQLPKLQAQQYTAHFSESGFSIFPHRFVREEVSESMTPTGQKRTIPIYEPDPSATAEFETLAIQCGDQLLYQADGGQQPCSFLGNTAQRLLDPTTRLIEHYQTSVDGVEVAWVVNARPSSAGPLQIQARFDGLSHVSVDSDGHLFADGTGTPRLSVSHATVVDAKGTRLEIPVTFDNGELMVVVPELALNDFTFPIAIDPTIGPAIGFGLPMASAVQRYPTAAWNSASGAYLVVWEDHRNGDWDIYGTRVLPGPWPGRVLDLNGIQIWNSPAGTSGWFPRVASNGSDWLVVWNTSGADIVGVRVTGATPGTQFVVCDFEDLQYFPDVASVGTDYLVVWLDTRLDTTSFSSDAGEVYGAVVSSGDIVSPEDGSGICIEDWQYTVDGEVFAEERRNLRVAGNGSKYLVVWDGLKPGTTLNGVYGAVITPGSGEICTARLSSGTSAAFLPTVAGQSSSWLVAWIDLGAGSLGRGKFVDNSGVGGVELQLTSGSEWIDSPAVSGNGTDYLLTWSHSGIRGIRITGGGTVGSAFDICPLHSTPPAVASRGSDYLVVWSSTAFPDGEGDVYAARVTASEPPNNVLDRIPVSTVTHGQQVAPALPRDNSISPILAVWEDSRSTPTRIYGARISHDSGIVDVNGLEIATGIASATPSVSATTLGWFVAWQDTSAGNGNISGRFVTNATPPPMSAVVPISSGTQIEKKPTVASLNDTKFLVVWSDNRDAALNGFDLYGALVSNPGTGWQSTSIGAITNGPGDQLFPSAASVGSGIGAKYIVAWETPGTGGTDIHGRFVSDTGSPAANLFNVCALANSSQARASVVRATDDSGAVVVWQDNRAGSANNDIYGIHVSTSGTLGTPANGLQISTSTAATDLSPAISASPTALNQGYFVGWTHQALPTIDVYGRRIILQGSTLSADPSGILAVNAEATSEGQEGVAVGTIHYGGIAYSLVVYSSQLSPFRLRANLIRFE